MTRFHTRTHHGAPGRQPARLAPAFAAPATVRRRAGARSARRADGIHRCKRTVGLEAVYCERSLAAWLRLGRDGLLVLLVLGVALLVHQYLSLDGRLSRDEARVDSVARMLAEHTRRARTGNTHGPVRARLESRLARTARRVAALEARSEAGARIVAEASRSVVFLQGAYGFIEAQTGRPLRHVTGPDVRPIRMARGSAVTLEGSGPVVEERFTGTAFVATTDKLLLTNRHVARPWETNVSPGFLAQSRLVPVMHRLVGYAPGSKEPFDVVLLRSGEDADIAVLQARGIPEDTPHLELGVRPPLPGEDVIILGYPTGVRALLARLDAHDVDALALRDAEAFWDVGRWLARAGHVGPLATGGIVGQVTAAAVVYDAETARGGSGGPVLGLDGRVLAINAAILPDFDGSNLGVPIEAARSLLHCATRPPAGECHTKRRNQP